MKIIHDLEPTFGYTYFMASSLVDKKVLVVDNSSIITKIIKNFLVQTGFDRNNIFVAHDRNQSMMMFDLEKFDLVTSGIHLKDASGIDLLQEIRKNSNTDKNSIPFLIISSEEQDNHTDNLKSSLPSGYLRKPFNQDQFNETVTGLLNRSNATEPEAPAEPAPTPSTGSDWEESPAEVPPAIVDAFSESTIEAMEQYMAEAIPEKSNGSVDLNGYFSSWVDLLSVENRIQITLLVNFPKDAACGIYEGIFGEVDIEQVCGVVQELANIIGGIVKPRISDFSKEFTALAHPQKDSDGDTELTWDLGLPETKMGDNHSLDMKLNGIPKFHVPFKIKDETFHLIVLIQEY